MCKLSDVQVLNNDLTLSVQRMYKLNNFNIVECILNMQNRLNENKFFFFFENNFIFMFPKQKFNHNTRCQFSIQMFNYPTKILSVIIS